MVPYNFGQILAESFARSYEGALGRKWEMQMQNKRIAAQKELEEERLNAQFESDRLREINAQTLETIRNKHAIMADRLRERGISRENERQRSYDAYEADLQRAAMERMQRERIEAERELQRRREMILTKHPITGDYDYAHPEKGRFTGRTTGGERLQQGSFRGTGGLYALARGHAAVNPVYEGGFKPGYVPNTPQDIEEFFMTEQGMPEYAARMIRPPEPTGWQSVERSWREFVGEPTEADRERDPVGSALRGGVANLLNYGSQIFGGETYDSALDRHYRKMKFLSQPGAWSKANWIKFQRSGIENYDEWLMNTLYPAGKEY